MSDSESILNINNHNKPDILPSTKCPDSSITMENTNDSTEEVLKKNPNDIYSPNISAQQTPEGTDFTHLIIDSTKFDNELEKKNVQDTKENNQKDLENNGYITIRIYDTYFGQQQPQQLPHQKEPFHRQSLQYQYQSPWNGGGTEPVDGEVLEYDPATRNSFVKLVFTIVFTMIVLTSIFIALVVSNQGLRQMFRRHYLMFMILGLVLLLTCHYALYLSPCARVPPCNILLLFVAVAAYCILAGNLSARYKTQLILYAAVATAAVVLVCLLLACSKFDFTSWLLYVIVIATVFSVITVIIFVATLITGHYPKPLHIAILIIGTLIQTVMLIIELQMILGGRSVELNENDYALGAFMLYTSIMSLFMNLLQLIGMSN